MSTPGLSPATLSVSATGPILCRIGLVIAASVRPGMWPGDRL